MAVAGAALGLSSCSETWDGNPVLTTHEGTPVVDILNAPALQDQYVTLSSTNKEGTVHLTCSQPEYGYAAIATYKVQVSLSENFVSPQKDPESPYYNAKMDPNSDQYDKDLAATQAWPDYVEIRQAFYNCAEIDPTNHDFAAAFEKLWGIQKENQLEPATKFQPVYVRLRSYIEQSPENTEYLSNVVNFKNIRADYFAVWIAGEAADLYLRGGFNEWGTGEKWQFFTAPEENTWICKNVSINANVSIKVSTATWKPINLGGNAGENDDSQMIKVGEEYAMTQGDNPGHMRLEEDFTGDVILRLADEVYYITFEPAEK